MGKRKYDADKEGSKKKLKTGPDEGVDEVDTEQPQNSVPTENGEEHELRFNVKQFRKDIAGKTGQTTVLTQFLQVCLNPDSEVDYMFQYLKVGGNSHEILRQLTSENKKNLTLATPVFHLFNLIILKVQSSFPHMITITEEACRYFLNTFMPTVEIMISENSGPRHRKIILKLLTSMVTLNADLGVEVLNQAPLTPKHLQYILEKANYKDKDNVRTTFVHFMTSFLVDGHLPLIKALLEKQGLLSLVIPGLVYDEPEAVLMFLNILKENVIENQFISKSLKLKTFSHQVLHNMFKIFSWKGPSEIHIESRNESRLVIEELLSDIIITLFTSHKLGLHFIDSSLGTSDANKNQNLYKAVLTLKRPWENLKECEVILTIVHKCPELHRAVISIIEQSFDPQHSPIWEKTVEFVMKLINKLNPQEMIPRMSSLPPPQAANFVKFITLPVPLLKYIKTNIGKDQTISIYCVKLLVNMLEILCRYIKIFEVDNEHTRVTDLKTKLEYFFPKHLPAPSQIVTLIKDIISDKGTEVTSQDYKLPIIGKTDSLILLTDLLLLYSDVHPVFFETVESSLNMKDILAHSKLLTTGPTSLLKFKIVSLWLRLDSSTISVTNPMFKELFSMILEVYISEDNNVWIEAKNTLIRFFRNTLIFEANEDEIDIMLYTLRKSKLEAPALIGAVLEYVLTNYNDLSEYVRKQMVHYEFHDEKSEENLEKLFNDLMENNKTSDTVFMENKAPSPFIVGCVQYILNHKDKKKSLKQFLCLYVANLLHCTYSPEVTEILIDDAKLDVRSYVASWTGKPMALPEAMTDKDVIVNKISRSLIDDDVISPDEIFNCLLESNEQDPDINIDGNSYKIILNGSIDSSELLIWAKYLMFCNVRLTEMDLLNENTQKKIENYFEYLIAIAVKQHMTDVCRIIILNMFKNRYFLKLYNPLQCNNSSSVLVTRFMFNVITKHADIVKHLNSKYNMLKPYQQKNYSELLKAFIKINKKRTVNTELTTQALDIIGLCENDDFDILNRVLNTELETSVKDNKEPSLVLEVLRVVVEKYAKNINQEFPSDLLKKIFKRYTDLLINTEITINLNNFETALILYFENKPQTVSLINESEFEHFFYASNLRKTTSQLAVVLMKQNIKFCAVFKKEVFRPEILSLRELTLPLGNALVDHKKFINENNELLQTIYKEYKSNILKMLEKPHKAGQVYINSWKLIQKLVLECMELEECEKLFSKLHKFEAIDLSHLKILHAAYLKLYITTKTYKKEQFSNYLITMMNLTILALKEGKEEYLVQAIITNIYSATTLLESIEVHDDFDTITKSSVWQNFCKAILKDCLKIKKVDQTNLIGPQLLFVLSSLVKTLYQSDHEDIVSLFEMATSHSEFLNIMLSHYSQDIKSRLIEFLFMLILKNKSVMKNQHVPVYLSAYRATRQPCDRIILTLLHHYEINGIPVNEYKPYVWGDSAANHYAVRKNKKSLWAHPSPNQVINLFDKDTIEKTVEYFPVLQKLEYDFELQPVIDITNNNNIFNDASVKSVLQGMFQDEVFKLNNSKDVEHLIHKETVKAKYKHLVNNLKNQDLQTQRHSATDDSIYDPAFLFPLLSHLLAPGSVASCFKMLRTGLLSVPVMALSSYCPMMRAAAYHVLHRFYLLLETETRHKNDKLLLSDFIETLRHSLSTAINNKDNNNEDFKDNKNPRLPAVDALYLAKALMVSTAPFDPLYKPVNNYLIAKQFIDLTVVPDFLSLFHDSDVESADRRLWILNVIKHGTKTMTDVNVIFKTMCLKMIMDFYSSTLSDRKMQESILRFLSSVVSIPRALSILVEGYGLISWLHYVVRIMGKNKSIFRAIVDVLENILYSLNIDSFSRYVLGGKNDQNKKSVDELQELRVNKDVEQEISIILFDMLHNLDDLDNNDIVSYVRCFKLLTRKSIQSLPKRCLVNLVRNVGNKLNCESVDLMLKSLVNNEATLLKSKQISDLSNIKTDNAVLFKEMRQVVNIYLN